MIPEELQNIDTEKIISLAKKAGEKVLEVYNDEEIAVQYKEGDFPLTLADQKSQDIIKNSLKELYPEIPILAEEEKEITYEERKDWPTFWLVDPLDGTKEFVNKIPEFTVNIALIYQNKPILGVIYTPATDVTFTSKIGAGAFKIDSAGNKERLEIKKEEDINKLKIIASRFHKTKELEDYVEKLKQKYKEVDYVSIGSSLKFCLIAENKAHIYPRLAPTMEWDTAAGQLIVEESGGKVIDLKTNQPMLYNKESLVNNYFIVFNKSIHSDNIPL